MDTKLPRRERERLRHRQEILEAARKVIAVRGLEGLTVEQVAREAEFAVGSIYRHFRSKEEMIEVLLGEFAEPHFEEIEALPGSGLPFAEQLDRLVRSSYEHRVESLPLLKVFVGAPGNLPSPDGERMRAFMMRHLRAFDGVLRVGQEEGALAPGDRAPMAVALTGLVESFSKWTMFGPSPLAEDVPALVCRAFLSGFGASR